MIIISLTWLPLILFIVFAIIAGVLGAIQEDRAFIGAIFFTGLTYIMGYICTIVYGIMGIIWLYNHVKFIA